MNLPFPQALAALFEPAPFGVFVIDAEGIIVYVNPCQCENSRLAPEDFMGKHYRTTFYTTLESQGLLPLYDRLQQEGTPFAVTLPRYQRHSDGALLAFSMRGYKHEGYTLLFTSIEKTLEVQQARYEQLFENANDGIFILDRQARFVTVNQRFAELAGMPREEIIGKTTELFLPGGFAQSLERLERILHKGKLGPYELEVTTPLGNKVLSFNAFALYEGNTPVGVMNIARDITDLKRVAEEMIRLSSTLRTSTDSIVLTDLEGKVTEVNDVTLKMYGADDKGDLLGKSAFDLIAPEDREKAFAGMEEVLDKGDIKGREYHVSSKNGSKIPVEMSVALIKDAEGRATGFVAISRDITDRKRAEAALRESEVRYRNLFENANDAIVSASLDGTITAVNRGLEVMLGWSRGELIGLHYRKITTPASAALGEERTRRALAGERLSPIIEAEMVRKDGSVVPVEGRTRFIRDKEGKPIGFQGIYRDISAKKALEWQRTEFLAMLTHDIRNPLGVILGYAEMLLDQAREREAHKEVDLLARLKSSALTVHSLVANYLDFSKIEAGHLTLTKEPLAVNSVLGQVGQQYEAEAQRRCLTLEVRLQDVLPWVKGDPLALERVFANLLSNALKFTPAGGRVRVSSAQQNGEVVVTVADTGPGIAAEDLPFLFEKYHRAAATQQHEGVGLGLFIAKALVAAHGGRIEVESTPGSGTSFAVFLPIALAEKTEAA